MIPEERPVTSQAPAIVVEGVGYTYGTRVALTDISFQIARGEIFALLGPNGGGKTTLFQLLATLRPVTQGHIDILGHRLPAGAPQIRPQLGVVFQAPALDRQLTVEENLRHHGHLYGRSGRQLHDRIDHVVQRLGLGERRHELVETLSGGLQRRVELAKALLHQPAILLMDEPSTGLDPGARLDFTAYLESLRTHDGVSILLTTHLLEEAERCDRVGIVHQGRLVALDTPDALKAQVGGDVVVIHTPDPQGLQARIQTRFGRKAQVLEDRVHVEIAHGHLFVHDVVEAFAADIRTVTFGKPTLADVFMHLTGHRFWGDEET